MKTASELISIIELEHIDNNIFRAQNYKAPWGRVFGGQVLAQSIHAARRTVPDDRFLHSMHGYFILGGDIHQPIIYTVDRIRDGKSFNTRRVVGIQKGRAIFNMSASFQIEESGFVHQISMPNVPPPDTLATDQQWASQFKESHPELYKKYQVERPIEFRPIERPNPLNPRNGRPFRHVWIRAKGKLPDSRQLHQEVLAYASDYNLMTTALIPNRESFDRKKMQLASLDHAMWFHHELKADDWLLYAIDSPSASNSRGFNRGNFFNLEGKLVASVVQEGLIRNRG